MKGEYAFSKRMLVQCEWTLWVFGFFLWGGGGLNGATGGAMWMDHWRFCLAASWLVWSYSCWLKYFSYEVEL